MALPKTIFVRKEKDATTDCLIAEEFLDDVVEYGGVTTVGRYRLELVQQYRLTSQVIQKSHG